MVGLSALRGVPLKSSVAAFSCEAAVTSFEPNAGYTFQLFASSNSATTDAA